MSPLIVHCPKTAAVFTTGIDMEYESLAKVWAKTIRVLCPHCNEEHEIKVRDAYVRGAVSNFSLRGD